MCQESPFSGEAVLRACVGVPLCRDVDGVPGETTNKAPYLLCFNTAAGIKIPLARAFSLYEQSFREFSAHVCTHFSEQFGESPTGEVLQ